MTITKINESISIERILISRDIKENNHSIKTRMDEIISIKQKLRILNSEIFELKQVNRKLQLKLELSKQEKQKDRYKNLRRPSICR